MKKDFSLSSPCIFLTDKCILQPRIIFRKQTIQVLKYYCDLYQKSKYPCTSSFIFSVANTLGYLELLSLMSPMNFRHFTYIIVHHLVPRAEKWLYIPWSSILKVFLSTLKFQWKCVHLHFICTRTATFGLFTKK